VVRGQNLFQWLGLQRPDCRDTTSFKRQY
jgi:hypothetical protein